MSQMEIKDDLTPKDGLAEVVVGIIGSPVATMRKMSRESSLRLSLTVFLLVMLVVAGTVLVDAELAAQLGGSVVVFVVLMPLSFLLLIIQAGVIFGVARLLGAKGSFSSLLSLLALANVPSLFMAPLALLSFVPGIAAGALYGLGSLVLTIWVVILNIIAVRETFQVTSGRALLICYLPILLLVVLVALVAGLALLL